MNSVDPNPHSTPFLNYHCNVSSSLNSHRFSARAQAPNGSNQFFPLLQDQHTCNPCEAENEKAKKKVSIFAKLIII